jgi:3D (Asp-Asp-Asp) domain-containing protein
VRARLARCCGTVVLALGGAAGIPAASLGDDPARQANQLRVLAEGLAQEQRSASVELEALGRSEAAARATLRRAHRLLALRLRTLYEAGDTDPLAVVLGAGSLQEALDGLDGLRYAAQQDRRIIAQTVAARKALARSAAAATARRAELAARRAATLTRIAELARAAESRRPPATRTAEPESNARPAPAPHAPHAPATLTVRAIGYSLAGLTATGAPTGWGVVAVDPGVIPLGTRLTIPGYGDAIAADTGPGVTGATIDLWFPTREQALAWGSRTITITLRS